MSVILLAEQFNNRSYSDDAKYNQRITRTFKAITNDENDNEDIVLLASPQLYHRHPRFQNLLVESRECTQQDDPKVWLVTITYANNLGIPASFAGGGGPGGNPVTGAGGSGGSGGGSQQSENPLQRGPVFEFSTETFQVYPTVDYTEPTAKRIQNSAWEPFNPVPQIEDFRIVFTHTYNRPSYDYTIFHDRRFCCNDNPFLNYFPAKSVLFVGHSAVSNYENDIFYWQIKNTYRVGADWDVSRVMDQGFRQLVYDDALDSYESVMIKDKYGDNITQPILLDGSGSPLGDTNDDGIQDDPVFREFTFYPAVDFSALE